VTRFPPVHFPETENSSASRKSSSVPRIRDRLFRFPPANRPFEELRPEHAARIYYERHYAYECIDFIKEHNRRGDVELNETVLGEAMSIDGGDGLLAWLGRRNRRRPARFKARQIAQMGDFSRSLHDMQLGTFRCDKLSAYGVDTAPSELKEEEAEKAISTLRTFTV
jgi:hypothetical protein